MSKRGMRAGGVCLVAVAVMSGSVTANGAVASDPVQELTADDFAVRFSATPTRVVLSPNGGKTTAEYRIVVRHPRSVDRVDSAHLQFQNESGGLYGRFGMRGDVVSRTSATRTVLSGRSGFIAAGKKNWAKRSAEAGIYRPRTVALSVTEGGESSSLRVTSPAGRIRVYYATKLVLEEPSRTASDSRLRLKGDLSRFAGYKYGSWSAATGERITVMFHRAGATEPRKVTSTKTDDGGDFSVDVRAHRPGRWWVRYRGDRLLDSSRSTGREVSPS